MEKSRRNHLPDYMTPQERLDRLIELLALATVRSAADEILAQAIPLDGLAEGKVRSVPRKEPAGGPDKGL